MKCNKKLGINNVLQNSVKKNTQKNTPFEQIANKSD
jgi:hypothetical protein